MSTIMPDSKRVRDAIKWVDSELSEGRSLSELLQEVGMRFNLGPRDQGFVNDFFTQKPEGDGENG
jgi:hypothetical protein